MTTKFDMTFDDWEEKYKPISNPRDGDILFETYEEDMEFVLKQNPACVWTDVDYDGKNFILSGLHFSNRLGYYVTEVPFVGETPIEVELWEDDDEDYWEKEWAKDEDEEDNK